MRSTLVWLLLLGLAFMGGLALLRFPFALRFWVRMRRLGYLYVALIIVLAALSVVLGKRL